jgi:hypothetical protein
MVYGEVSESEDIEGCNKCTTSGGVETNLPIGAVFSDGGLCACSQLTSGA